MKLYDAKQIQSCKICHISFSHNKQGRFTSHLKNEHNISLEKYLVTYFYSCNELRCSYELCQNLVGLYRGKPKNYSSISCGSKGKPLVCILCGEKFDTKTRPNRATKTCSDECERTIRSYRTSQWHKRMSDEEKKEHFSKIISKTAKTRRKNNTPSWNSGKKGVYSDETIEKIRLAALKQMESQVFQKTNIEKIMEEYLIQIGVEYLYSFILEKRQYEFILIKNNVLIECDGDYWHANPKFYPVPLDWQKERIEIDKEKNDIATRNGYQIVRFWEDDIVNNFEFVKGIINDLLATT